MEADVIEQITQTIEQLNSLVVALTLFIPSCIGLCSVVSAALPRPAKDGLAAKVHNVVNKLAFNFGHAANKQ